MNRKFIAVLLVGLIGIATFDWLIAINVVFAVLMYDWLLKTENAIEKEDEENLQEVKDYIAAMQESERQRNRDIYFENFIREGDSNGCKD